MATAPVGYEFLRLMEGPMQRIKPVYLFFFVLLFAAACSTPTPTSPPSTKAAPTQTATPSGAWISLSPAHGNPGDSVTIDGYMPVLPASIQAGNPDFYVNVCWGGCADGLQEQALPTTWSQTDVGHFSTTFVVPSTAWLGADGPHNLTVGDYAVSIQYLDIGSTACADPSAKGCSVEIASGQPFHLDTAAAGPTCDKQDCGTLTLTPDTGKAGDTIELSGWAPLLELIGTTPSGYSGYSLVLMSGTNLTAQSAIIATNLPVSQELDGTLSGSFQLPQTGPNGVIGSGTYTLVLSADALINATQVKTSGYAPVVVASAPFEISAATAWAQLATANPLWIQPSASLLQATLGIDPANPQRIASCADGSISITVGVNAAKTSVPTAGVAAIVDSMGYALNNAQTPRCNAVTLDPRNPQSIYAVFEGASKQYGAPPEYFLGFYTTDAGKTWLAAPTPANDQGQTPIVERFGGFWNAGDVVQALYSGENSNQPNQAPPTLVLQTADGGKTWQPGELTCPSGGPCLRWSAAPGSISGMGAGLPEYVLASQDNGQTWTSTGQYAELHVDGPHQLAALSSSTAALISGDAQYPLQITQDGGKTWQPIDLPTLPGADVSTGFAYNGLQLLPNGNLAAMSPDSGTWYALTPGASDWCTLNLTVPGNYPVVLQPADTTVWFISPVDETVQGFPLTDFSCSK